MGKLTIFLIVLGVAFLAAAALVNDRSVPEGAGVIRGILLAFGSLTLAMSLLSWFFDGDPRPLRAKLEQQLEQQLRAATLPATARILKVERGHGWTSDTEASVQLTLQVEPPGQPAYVTQFHGAVSLTFAGQLRPNERLAVGVSPVDRNKVFIFWGEAPLDRQSDVTP
jgi:hypothetical protein